MTMTDLKYNKSNLIQRLRFDFEHEEDMEITDLEQRFYLIIQVLKDNKLITEIEEGQLNNEFKTLLRILDEYY